MHLLNKVVTLTNQHSLYQSKNTKILNPLVIVGNADHQGIQETHLYERLKGK